MTKNPFTEPEDLKVWLEQNYKYTTAREKSLQSFLQSRNLQPTFYNLISIFMNTFHKYTAATFVVGILIFSTIGTVAVENFAPIEYKPSSIFNFSSNKQVDKNPYTALAPDEKNYVANLENCDLALKYPRQVNGKNTEFWKVNNGYRINTVMGKDKLQTDLYSFSVSCDDYIGEDLVSILEENKGKGDTPFFENLKTTNLTNEDLRNKTGWLVTQKSLSDISEITYETKDSQQKILTNYTLKFKNGNKFYQIQGNFDKKEVQLQFNSVTTNKLSADILKAKKQDGSVATNCLEDLNITYNSSLLKFENSTIKDASLSINNNTSAKVESSVNPASVNIICENSENKPKNISNDGFELVKSDINKIPFISASFKGTINPNSVFERVYKLESKPDGMTEGKYQMMIDHHLDLKKTKQIHFTTDKKSYYISVTNPTIVEKEFNLKIDLKSESV